MEHRPRNHNKTETEQTEEQAIPLRYGCDDVWTWNKHEKSPEVRFFFCC